MSQSRPSLAALIEQVRSMERATPAASSHLPSGLAPLDEILPAGGFRAGATIEWLADVWGAGAWSLAFASARQRCRGGGVLVVIDRSRQFHPLPLLHEGWERSRLLLLRPETDKEELWAWEHVLRCRGVASVVGEIDKASHRSLRRLQLAAESGLTLGQLLRHGSARKEPSWADVRILVEPLPSSHFARPPNSAGRLLRLTLLYARGGIEGQSIEVCWNEETSTLSLASRLGDPAKTRHPGRGRSIG